MKELRGKKKKKYLQQRECGGGKQRISPRSSGTSTRIHMCDNTLHEHEVRRDARRDAQGKASDRFVRRNKANSSPNSQNV